MDFQPVAGNRRSDTEIWDCTMNDETIHSLIEKNRKGDFTIEAHGAPTGTPVRYRSTRLAFDLGTVLYRSYFRLAADHADRVNLLDRVREYFNIVTVPLFWHTLEPEPGVYDDRSHQVVCDWCVEHGKKMFGHSIFYGWDGADDADPADRHLNFIQPWVRALEPRRLEQAMKEYLARMLRSFGGKLSEFVLANEVLGKTTLELTDYFSRTLGFNSLEPYFRWAHDLAPRGFYFYLNENSILFGSKLQPYVEMIGALIEAGVKIGGIGVQGHMMTDTIPSDEQIWRALDALSVFELPIRITEFGIQTKDESHYADDMVRFYRLCMAHPSVKGITRWGIWEPEMWNRDWPVQECHLWDRNWSITPGGKQYVDLVKKEWNSEGAGSLNNAGEFAFRGFHGTYEVRIGTRAWTVEFGPDSIRQAVVW